MPQSQAQGSGLQVQEGGEEVRQNPVLRGRRLPRRHMCPAPAVISASRRCAARILAFLCERVASSWYARSEALMSTRGARRSRAGQIRGRMAWLAAASIVALAAVA